MTTVINISGSSGVGKTTLSELLCFVLDSRKVTTIHGDDLHLWERSDEKWNEYTHLNPRANNLKLGYDHMFSLALLNNGIQRSLYNHETGEFDPSIKIFPKEYIINEGLHSLYGNMNDLADISIFIETDESLKRQWKLNRDIQKRGYTKEQVEDTLKRRKKDERLYIHPQKENADIIVYFKEKRDKAVHLEYECINGVGKNIIEQVKKLYDMHREFLLLCKKVSFEYDLVQHGGGNVSYKFNDNIIITSSGREMNEISMLSGFSLCDNNGKRIKKPNERPSMEVGVHLKVKHPVVFHTHPIYLNTILCTKESKPIISEILKDYDYDYISYTTPGEELKNAVNFNPENNIILLENHGLICSGSSFVEVFDMSLNINQLCKEWLIKNSKEFKSFATMSHSEEDRFLFPDAVVLEEKMKPINQYLIHTQKGVGLTPRFLSYVEADKLLSMDEEKYRKALV